MPIKEVVSTQSIIPIILPAEISATTVGAILDTADYDNGVYFFMVCNAYTDGTWTMLIEQSSSATFAGSVETTVSGDQLINALPALTAVNAATAIGTVTGVAKVGVISTERYLRVTVTETVSGTATIGVYATVNPEIAKTAAII